MRTPCFCKVDAGVAGPVKGHTRIGHWPMADPGRPLARLRRIRFLAFAGPRPPAKRLYWGDSRKAEGVAFQGSGSMFRIRKVCFQRLMGEVMNWSRGVFSFRAGLMLALLSAVLFLGCKAGEPGGSSSGGCSGGSVFMLDTSSVRPFCSADDIPTLEMTASTLNCPLDRPTAPIIVDCNGGPGAWTQCQFEAFRFEGLSVRVASTFSGTFLCGGVSNYSVVFSPASELATASGAPTVRVNFQASGP